MKCLFEHKECNNRKGVLCQNDCVITARHFCTTPTPPPDTVGKSETAINSLCCICNQYTNPMVLKTAENKWYCVNHAGASSAELVMMKDHETIVDDLTRQLAEAKEIISTLRDRETLHKHEMEVAKGRTNTTAHSAPTAAQR